MGILGGTFNPPHLGHLVCAQEAHAQLGLDRVTWIPTNVPPHKQLQGDPGPGVRLELCERAVAGDDRFDVSAIELERGGPSYTVDTLRALSDQAPEDQLIFIAGGDMARSLPAWREPEQVLALATFAVAERAGAGRRDIADQLGALTAGAEVRFFAMPRIDVSSSDVRRRVAERRPVRYLVPDAVAAAIEERGLYR
ncbi:MAG TPA: nicotinate-nucleotide adenylyltransferase [Solirubrobacteraceae bacterium]|nr:nicotinate-nucleotide adenylyltransferase [Solirubrobacteraceae bacterium]